MALFQRAGSRLALMASARSSPSLQTAAASSAYSSGASPSPSPYEGASPPAMSRPTGLSKAAEFVISKVDDPVNWARRGSLWPMTFGLACCVVEMMHTGDSRVVPVDIYVLGCPPTAEALLYRILQLQKKINRRKDFLHWWTK